METEIDGTPGEGGAGQLPLAIDCSGEMSSEDIAGDWVDAGEGKGGVFDGWTRWTIFEWLYD
jgi:hypothetical protein